MNRYYNNIYYLSFVVVVLVVLLVIGKQANKLKKLSGPLVINQLVTPKPTPTQTKTKQLIRLIFVGDIMLDRHIRLKAQNKGYNFILSDLSDLLSQADVVIGNLEGPITNKASVSLRSRIGGPNNYTFTFEPKVVEFLSDYNIKLVNLGNNHILNFGLEGLKSTHVYLNQAKIDFFGYPSGDKPSFLIKDIKGYKIAFINYNQFDKAGQEQTLADIKAVKTKSDLIILYTHWGVEYQPVANPAITNLAHSFIDQGVDLIIGSHPHVIQNTEEYKDKKIYYSLGNFIFDQYFSPQVQKGLVVKVIIKPTTSQVDYVDYYVKLETNGQTVLIN